MTRLVTRVFRRLILELMCSDICTHQVNRHSSVKNVVRRHTHATKGAPFQDAKQFTPYAQSIFNSFVRTRLKLIAEELDPEDSSHIPTESVPKTMQQKNDPIQIGHCRHKIQTNYQRIL